MLWGSYQKCLLCWTCTIEEHFNIDMEEVNII